MPLDNDKEGLSKKMYRGWGMLFRPLFICSIGFIGYSLISPHDIRSIPISQLTLKEIGDNILAAAIPIICIVWFFNFPKSMDKGGSALFPDPYVSWANGSVSLFLIGYFIWELFLRHGR